MGKRDKIDGSQTTAAPPVDDIAPAQNVVLLQGFSDGDVAIVQSQLSRFGLTVISGGDRP